MTFGTDRLVLECGISGHIVKKATRSTLVEAAAA